MPQGTPVEYVSAADTVFTVDGVVCGVDIKTRTLLWTVDVEKSAYNCFQPPELPVIVLAARHSELDRMSGLPTINRLSALVLDKKTGRTLYQTQETLPPNTRGIQFIPLPDEKKLVLDFQTWNLTFSYPAQSD